jgi:hypothetical protein
LHWLLAGALRAGGPRHDNDSEDYRRIAIVPSQDELLCGIDPYLPCNRWVNCGQISEFLAAVLLGHFHVACWFKGMHLSIKLRLISDIFACHCM